MGAVPAKIPFALKSLALFASPYWAGYPMDTLLLTLLVAFRSCFKSRAALQAENLGLRHQIGGAPVAPKAAMHQCMLTGFSGFGCYVSRLTGAPRKRL